MFPDDRPASDRQDRQKEKMFDRNGNTHTKPRHTSPIPIRPAVRTLFAKRLKIRIVQTEAERRRREAGVKQSMEIRLRSCMYVCMWVCMVFGIISRTKACTTTNEVLKCRSPERALLRHNIIGVRLLTNARRAKMPK